MLYMLCIVLTDLVDLIVPIMPYFEQSANQPSNKANSSVSLSTVYSFVADWK